MRNVWKNYSLSITLAILFLASWGVQTWSGWEKYASDQMDKGSTPTVFGTGGYVWDWAEATFENWQSEFLQLFAFVVLTSFLIHKGSHESKDSDDEMRAILEDVQKRVHKLEEYQTSTHRKAS